MTYSTSQTLTLVNDSLVTNTSGATSLSVIVANSNAGATLLVEGSSDGVNWSTLNTITTAGTYPITFGAYLLVRARISVQGAASFLVTLTAVVAGQNVTTVRSVVDVAVTPTVTAGAYTAGQEVGGLLTFPNVFSPSFTGTLTDILVKCKSVQTTTYKLYLFSQQPTATTWTDKTTPAINAADLPFLLGVFTTGASDSGLGTETTNQLDNIQASIRSNAQALYGILTAVATPTYTSTSDVTVSVRVRQN